MSVEHQQAITHIKATYGVELGEPTNSGSFNDVYLCPEIDTVFRFPLFRKSSRDDEIGSVAASMTRFGVDLLYYLHENASTPPPVQIPTIKEVYENTQGPVYMALGYMAGKTVLDKTAREEFSREELASFGRTVAEFTYWMAQNVPIEMAQRFGQDEQGYPSLHLSSLRMDHRARLRFGVQEENRVLLEQTYPTIAELHNTLLATSPSDVEAPPIFGHYDLRPDNFLFQMDSSGKRAACGLLDFEVCRPSTPAMELRHLAFLGETAVSAGIHQYKELSGIEIARDDLTVYAGINCIALILTCIDIRAQSGLVVVKEYLEQLYPTTDWSELTTPLPSQIA